MGDPLDFKIGFESEARRLDGEQAERLAMGKRVLPFNVAFLDDALGGILPTDLVLIGASTGSGKTTLASVIAQENAKAGKRVHYFALEAESKEIGRRIKYRMCVDAFYRAEIPVGRERLNYRDWYTGKLQDLLGRFEEVANVDFAKQYSTLNVYYRGKVFDAAELERLLLAVQDQTDLVILDHLHYVDTDDQNENRGVKQIVKVVRDTSLAIGKPVVVIAHLRKKNPMSPRLVPDLDDFHGTSDITKIATKVLMLAPARDQPQRASYLWDTYIHAPKDRMGVSNSGYVAIVTFNARKGVYEPEYSLGRVTGKGWEALAARDIPEWCR